MTAEIIELWLARKGLPKRTPKRCMYEPRVENSVIDHNCPCQGCREFFTAMQPLNNQEGL